MKGGSRGGHGRGYQTFHWPRGLCELCGRSLRVLKDGTIATHQIPKVNGNSFKCEGSRTQPKE